MLQFNRVEALVEAQGDRYKRNMMHKI